MLVKWSIELFGYYEWDNKIQITWTLKYIIAFGNEYIFYVYPKIISNVCEYQIMTIIQ